MRQAELGHQRQRLDAAQRVRGGVRVHRRHRAVVAGVQRLQHVERLGAAHLADDDAVRSHPQRVAHELADRDLAPAFEVRRAALEPHHVVLLQAQLGSVLDRDHPLARRDQR